MAPVRYVSHVTGFRLGRIRCYVPPSFGPMAVATDGVGLALVGATMAATGTDVFRIVLRRVFGSRARAFVAAFG